MKGTSIRSVQGGNVWRDILGDALALRATGAGVAPNVTDGVVEFSNVANSGDYLYTNIQLNHDRDPSMPISPHIHWFQTGAVIPNFVIQYRWHTLGQLYDSTWKSLATREPAFTYTSGTLHQICQCIDIMPPAGTTISDIVQFKIYRDTNNSLSVIGASESGVQSVVQVLAFDVHIAIDTLGSMGEYSKY